MTTLPNLTPAQFALQLAKLFPNGWANSSALLAPVEQNTDAALYAGLEEALETGDVSPDLLLTDYPGVMPPTGVIYALLLAISTQLAFVLSALSYAKNSINISTATAPELDLASQDFFGSALPRPPGMSDSNFAALIKANLFGRAATRPALAAALLTLTGKAPRMLEPWAPGDTGAWGSGVSYWGGYVNGSYFIPDAAATPFRWGSPGLRYQGFIETAQAEAQPGLGGNPPPSWGAGFYWDRGPGLANEGAYALAFMVLQPAYASNLNATLTRLHAEGTVIWVRTVTNPK